MSFKDFVSQIFERERTQAEKDLQEQFDKLLSGVEPPTDETIAQYAIENNLDISTTFNRAFSMLNRHMKIEDVDPVTGVDANDSEPIAPKLSREDAATFEKDDVVKHTTTDTDSVFYGKKFDVVETDGDFVRIAYIGSEGKEDLVWFRKSELEKVDNGDEEESTEGLPQPAARVESMEYGNRMDIGSNIDAIA